MSLSGVLSLSSQDSSLFLCQSDSAEKFPKRICAVCQRRNSSRLFSEEREQTTVLPDPVVKRFRFHFSPSDLFVLRLPCF